MHAHHKYGFIGLLFMASIQQTPQGPVIVLKESALQQKGKEAQQNNITAAKLVSELVRSSLGPRGLDKMLVDSLGDVTITNDGATILKEIDVQHPAAKMMVEISKTVDNEVGDGTTSSVVFGGALLEKAEDLLKRNVHSSVIVEGYQLASEKTLELLQGMAKTVKPDDEEILIKIAKTSMQSKLISEDGDPLSKVVVRAVMSIAAKKAEKFTVDLENIKVEKKAGGSIQDTSLIKGIVLDKEVVHSGMPTRIQNAKIALFNSALEIEKTEISSEIKISDPTQMQMFLDEENRMLKTMVDKLHNAGVNVLLCQKGIDDLAQHYLAKHGIMAVRRVKESDMTKLAKATGGRVISNIDDVTSADLFEHVSWWNFFSTLIFQDQLMNFSAFFAAILMTALTTTFESGSPSSEISFDCMLVFAIFIKISSSSGFTVFAMPCSNSNVFSDAS